MPKLQREIALGCASDTLCKLVNRHNFNRNIANLGKHRHKKDCSRFYIPPYTVKFTVAHNCHVKSKSLASKAKVSRQKQKSRVKSKSLASKAKVSRQKQNARRKSKTLAAKAKRSPQKQNARRKSKTLASKAKLSRQK